MSMPPVIATSIAPVDERDVQPGAIESWLTLGFTLVSVNTAEEIEVLRPMYPGVNFVVAERTAERFAGRPVPFIFDLLNAAKRQATDGQVIGLTNADIVLRPLDGLPTFMAEEAEGCVLLGPRVDVPDQQAMAGFTPLPEPVFSLGYDYVLMGHDVTAEFDDSPFAMGMPFWDFWLPLTAYLAGRPLKALNSPVALHVAHETQWDDTIYLFFHALIAYALDQSRRETAKDSPKTRQLLFMLDVVSHVYGTIFENGTAAADGKVPDEADMAALANFYDRFQETAVHTIKANAKSITFG